MQTGILQIGFFPDKAIDIIDEVGSRMRLQHIKLPQSILDIQKEIEITQEKKTVCCKKIRISN